MLMTVYMLTKNVQILNWCSNTDEQPLALLQGKKKIDDKKTTNKKNKLKHELSRSKHTIS